MTTIVTLNTRGLPLKGTRIAERCTKIATELGAGDIDMVCLQEVFTYRQLAHLRRPFPHVAYRRSALGPAGGLVILSRLHLAGSEYARLPQPRRGSRLPVRARVNALRSGMLSVRLADSGVRVVNVHPVANTDGDWSEGNRFRHVQSEQFDALARVVAADNSPTVVCGDFNTARSSTLHGDLWRRTGLRDAFNGECPPTFHQEFLPPGSTPHCIDFILATEGLGVEETDLLFTDRRRMTSGTGYVSDHIGLLARLGIP
ncbi:endonuclease/exonuclease/phosphatase family protein [Kribbella amoyensis]|nr:endonuclease/exonuclease/phosphatase family protein [Kribbella amoyensis]